MTMDGKIAVQFEGLGNTVRVFPHELTRGVPSVPGGYFPGDIVYFVGGTKCRYAAGSWLERGQRGEVIGRAAVGDGTLNRRVKVAFEGCGQSVDVLLTEIAWARPDVLVPIDICVGDMVYYNGGDRERFSENDGKWLTKGLQGEVVGSLANGDPKRITVVFQGFDNPIGVFCHEVSRWKPAPKHGYSVGDFVHYVSRDKRYAGGRWLNPGLCGRVVGLQDSSTKLDVLFEDGGAVVAVFPHEVSLGVRNPVCFGYHPGDPVFYTGHRNRFHDGDWMPHGLCGSIVGP